MKVGIITDIHYGQYSSIIRMRGKKYSKRLEVCIDSLNWAEDLFEAQGCDQVFCLGDFFDHAHLGAEELTALNELKQHRGRHVAIVGNHELTNANREFNSMSILRQLGWEVISEPTIEKYSNISYIFLPYIVEEERKPFAEYMKGDGKRVVFSHNDIKGIRYGAFVSEEGFDLAEIEANCDLFLNGHLHNSQFLNDDCTILNVGNLTGQNFGEDAFRYKHYACILDTDTLELKFYENPYALNFIKLDLTWSESKLSDILTLRNPVVTIKAYEEQIPDVKMFLEDNNIIASRVIAVVHDMATLDSAGQQITLNAIDHLQLLRDFALEKLGATQAVKEELSVLVEGN